MKKTLASFLLLPDGTVLQSYNRHDYKTHIDRTDGQEYMIDGGPEYLRCSMNALPYAHQVTTDDTHKMKRRWFHWGTYGKNGDRPLQWKPLELLDTDHIQAIIETQTHIPDYLRDLFKDELSYREQTTAPHKL